MARLSKAAFDEAERRGREHLVQDARAVTARIDPDGHIVVELSDGSVFTVPAGLVQDLQGAAPADLLVVQVDGQGFNLHWPRLGVDVFVPALVSGVFGTAAWMAALERRKSA